ncbi:MAG TPA: methyltransferase [Longimicrobiales bacterium]|nr:methyltransferase [Longimicrobiales bacterium]
MDTIRYVLAVVVWATVPPAFFYWYLIHPFASYWRTVGPARTYMVVLPVTVLLIGMLLRWRGPVAGTDLGENWTLFYSGIILWGAAILLERRIRKLLDFKTLAGLPELRAPEEGAPPQQLLDSGIYGVVRHPRYMAVFLGTLGWSLMANYGAAYAVVAALVPGILALVWLEERELEERFGDAYRAYQARVPALIPRLGRGALRAP